MGKKRRKQRRSNVSNKNQQTRSRKNTVSENEDIENQESCPVITCDNELSENVAIEKPKKVNKQIKILNNVPPPIGLSNLGNTCFFNSIMQNLIGTPLLHKLLKDEIASSSKESVVVDPNDGQTPPLTFIPTGLGEQSIALSGFFDSIKSMQKPMHEVNSNKKVVRNKIFSPRNLFNKICAKNERFRGYQQQDSQELYHCLLDAVKMEEIKRKKKGILNALNLNKPSADEIPDEVRQRVKAYGRVIMEKEDTIVEKVFGGTLISSVLCDNCCTVTGVIEPFHDISLPIVEEKLPKPNRKEKITKSDESDQGSVDEDNTTNKKPLSKHAMKKAKRAADKAARRSRRNTKRDSERADESFEHLANSLADEAVSLALRSLSLSNETQEEQEQESSEREESEDGDPVEAKLRGGAVSVQGLNLPTDDQLAEELESKLKLDNEESEKEKDIKNEETKKATDIEIEDSEKVSDLEIEGSEKVAEVEIEELEKVTDLEMDESVKDNDVVEESLTTDKNHEDNHCATNGINEASPDDTSSVQDPSSGEESSAGSPTFTKREASLFDTPKRHEPTYTSLPSCYNLPDTLASREPLLQRSRECSLQSCFFQFTMPELLTGSNQFGCEVCTKRQKSSGDGEKKTVYCNASKQILIKTPPQVLTIHLKRFQQVGCSLRKVNKYVALPTILDISPFCSHSCEEFADEDMKIVYGLYGMVEHSGSLSRGHYTAYVRLRNNEDPDPDSGVWYHISDCKVTKVSAAKALKCNAYLVFYERLSRSPVR